MNKTINLYLDKEIIDQAKRQAVARGFGSINHYFTRLIRDMDKRSTKNAREILYQ